MAHQPQPRLRLVRGPAASAQDLARRNREICELAEDHTVEELADAYSLSVQTVAAVLREKRPASRRRVRRRVSDRVRHEVVAAYLDGFSQARIAGHHRLHQTTVAKLVRESGVESPRAVHLAARQAYRDMEWREYLGLPVDDGDAATAERAS